VCYSVSREDFEGSVTYPRSPTNIPKEFVVSEVNSDMERARGPNQKKTLRLR
jgi:hypothetical protein